VTIQIPPAAHADRSPRVGRSFPKLLTWLQHVVMIGYSQ
jgi:hypothetical protein